jgi:hypothetical protein
MVIASACLLLFGIVGTGEPPLRLGSDPPSPGAQVILRQASALAGARYAPIWGISSL